MFDSLNCAQLEVEKSYRICAGHDDGTFTVTLIYSLPRDAS